MLKRCAPLPVLTCTAPHRIQLTGTSKTDHKSAESKPNAGLGHTWKNPDSTHGKGEKKSPEQVKTKPELKQNQQRTDKQHKQVRVVCVLQLALCS